RHTRCYRDWSSDVCFPISKKRDGWEAFHALARRVERAGVGALPPRQIPAFAARYREVAADLARARTYGVDPRVIEYLERVVSARSEERRVGKECGSSRVAG